MSIHTVMQTDSECQTGEYQVSEQQTSETRIVSIHPVNIPTAKHQVARPQAQGALAPSAPSAPTILLVGHGSRRVEGNEEVLRFAADWRGRSPGLRIESCFIEHAEILLDAGLDLAAAGSREVVILPFILNAAGHVKMEIPAAAEAARRRHPGVDFRCLPHLGMGREVHEIVMARLAGLMRELAMPDPRTTGIVLLGRGSSDPGANGEVARLARWVLEAGAHDLVDIAFTGITFPRLETVVQRQARLGMTQCLIQPIYLFTGVLMLRIAAQVERLTRQYPGMAFALGGSLGFDEGIFALLEARARGVEETAGGLLECDGCKYRQAAVLAASGPIHHDNDSPMTNNP
jgi:sirohydrochlorin cobaltochelatase